MTPVDSGGPVQDELGPRVLGGSTCRHCLCCLSFAEWPGLGVDLRSLRSRSERFAELTWIEL